MRLPRTVRSGPRNWTITTMMAGARRMGRSPMTSLISRDPGAFSETSAELLGSVYPSAAGAP